METELADVIEKFRVTANHNEIVVVDEQNMIDTI